MTLTNTNSLGQFSNTTSNNQQKSIDKTESPHELEA